MASNPSDIKDNLDSLKIASEITNVRDLDGETSKPRLKNSYPIGDSHSSKADHKTHNKARSKPDIPQSTFQVILTPYLRSSLEGIIRADISTYVPSPHMMYYITHLMDEIIRRNTYFRRQQDDWFPLISRLYFGIVFIVQTLRAQNTTSRLSTDQKQFLYRFLKDYPPEILPIPGPLVSLFGCLTSANPPNQLEGIVTPAYPQIIGPANAAALMIPGPEGAFQLLVPNIPLLLGLCSLITTAQPNAIPNFADPSSFNNTVDRTINGHLFSNNAWTQLERDALMTPGLLYPVETDSALNISFNAYGPRLRLPIPAGNTPIDTTDRFLCMSRTNDWFGNILPIMESYSSYFLGSTTLSACSSQSTTSPFITCAYATASAPEDINNFSQLTHAFPEHTPFALDCQHSTTEIDLPPTSNMLAQSAQLNIEFPGRHYERWNLLGTQEITRHGPYWSRTPIFRSSSRESCFKGYSSIISKQYSLSRPLPKQNP